MHECLVKTSLNSEYWLTRAIAENYGDNANRFNFPTNST